MVNRGSFIVHSRLLKDSYPHSLTFIPRRPQQEPTKAEMDDAAAGDDTQLPGAGFRTTLFTSLSRRDPRSAGGNHPAKTRWTR